MFLFDLQTVGFWALKNATKISDIHTPGLGFLLDPVARNFRTKFELPKSHRVNRQKSTPTKNKHQSTAVFYLFQWKGIKRNVKAQALLSRNGLSLFLDSYK